MGDQNQVESVPHIENRPDYQRLRNILQASENGPDDVARKEWHQEFAKTSADGQGTSIGKVLEILFQQLFRSWFGNELPVRESAGAAARQKSEDRPPIFRVPQFAGDVSQRQVNFAAELPGGIKGIADEDSYLFVTADSPSQTQDKKYRAFVVSKSDPKKQHEISLQNAELDTIDRHEFSAILGMGQKLVIGTTYASINGKYIRDIDSNSEINRLVEQPDCIGTSVAERDIVTGDSWTFIQKDIESGRVTRFTQSGTSHLGRVEVFQGEAGQQLYDSEVKAHRLSSTDGVPLPAGMIEQAREYLQGSGGELSGMLGMLPAGMVHTFNDRAQQSLSNLVSSLGQAKRPDQTNAIAKLNVGEDSRQNQRLGNARHEP